MKNELIFRQHTFLLAIFHFAEDTFLMATPTDIEKKATKYAADKLRELRGNVPRAKFAARLNTSETTIFQYENELSRLNLNRLASIALELGVPLSFFILPDEEFQVEEEREEATA